MAATLVLILVLTFLVGGLMLALAMGYRSIEESRAQQVARPAKAPSAATVVMIPSFFAPVENLSPGGPAVAFDDALLARLEQHVRAEHAMVAQFVHFPSIDSLYRQSGSSLHVH
jgi:ABC-type amino acid transport substrate-binding protein